MSGALSAATLTSLATGLGAVASIAQATRKPPTPNIPTPEKPPQAAKAPDRAAFGAANAAAARAGGGMSGNSSTFLTGPSGVAPGSLNLGRNKLLGD